MNYSFPLLGSYLVLSLVSGCGSSGVFHPSAQRDVTAAGSPLGPSYLLVPLPNDDDSLLGRILLDVPENGRSLDEVSRPNECADKLTPKKIGPLASTFEDAQELAAGVRARAALGLFGFEGDAQSATHFYYKLEVNKRVAQTDTTDYVACCKQKGSCGYGFVSALVYGAGEYATVAESNAEGGVSVPVAGGAGGFVRARVLHRRTVHGYVAALVTVTDGAKAKATSVLGDPAASGVQLTEQSLPEQVKARFDMRKIVVQGCNMRLLDCSGQPAELQYEFHDGSGAVTENDFVRRYQALVGASDLDGASRLRSKGTIIAGGAVAALSAGVLTYGLLNLRQACGPNDQCPQGDTTRTTDKGVLATGFGGGFLALGAGMIIYGAATADGTKTDHVLTKFDAQLYAAKYNRALLRETVRETKERMSQLSGKSDVQMPSLTIAPVLAPSFAGLLGSF